MWYMLEDVLEGVQIREEVDDVEEEPEAGAENNEEMDEV